MNLICSLGRYLLCHSWSSWHGNLGIWCQLRIAVHISVDVSTCKYSACMEMNCGGYFWFLALSRALCDLFWPNTKKPGGAHERTLVSDRWCGRHKTNATAAAASATAAATAAAAVTWAWPSWMKRNDLGISHWQRSSPESWPFTT